ncbi:oligosaccharide flippase family protein [Enterococcus sp. N249-2]
MESAKKKLLSNLIYQSSYQVLLVLLPIITTPIITQRLSPESTGLFKYVSSVAQYFILIGGLGLANYGVREIALVRNSRDKLSNKFWELQYFNLFFSLSTVIVYLIVSLFSPNKTFFLIYGIAVFSTVLDISWFFSGLEDFKKITMRNFFVKILSLAFIIVFVKNDGDLWIYILINALSSFIGQSVLWISIFSYIDVKLVSLKDIWKHFHPALKFFVAKIATIMYGNTTSFLLGALTIYSNVGLYSYSNNLISIASSVLSATNMVMIPRMTNLFAEDNEEAMIKMFKKVIMSQLFLTIGLTFGIMATNEKLIGWFIDVQYKDIIPFVYLLAPSISFQILQMSVASMWLIPKNQMKEYNRSVLVGGLLCIILNLLTIPLIGVYGSVLSISTAYMYVCIVRFRYMYIHTTFKFDWNQILKNIFGGLVMFITIYLVTANMMPSFLTSIVQVVIGVVIYLLISLVLKSNPLLELIKK